MRVLCAFGRFNYGDPAKGDGYEFVNFIPALEELGCQVTFFDIWDRSSLDDFAALNRRFLETVESEQPDIILAVLRNYEIWLETWDLVRRSGIATTVNWATDDNWKYSQFSRLIAAHFDGFATTYAESFDRYVRDGLTQVFQTQWAASGDALRPPLAAAYCRYAVSFVGAAHGNRPEWIGALRARGIDVDCFGYGWDRGTVASSEIPEIVRNSVISLNFANAGLKASKRLARQNQIKARTFEVPGSGGFLLTQSAPHLDRYYLPGSEIEAFDGLDELVSKIQFYLANPAERDRIAWNGFERTRAEHTYVDRMRELLQFAQARPRVAPGPPQDRRIDWQAFERAEDRHRMSPGLNCLRTLLTSGCSRIWGPDRGPRAARRLAFELSWRIAGDQTYTAAGWPGRMFYSVS